MTVLAECAYPRERAAMAKFLYDHMKFDPSVDVHITVSTLLVQVRVSLSSLTR